MTTTQYRNQEPPTKRSQALLNICLFAAMTDGNLCEAERENLQILAGEIGGDVQDVMREILLGKQSLSSVGSAFQQPRQKLLAYEMARAVCEADGGINEREQAFL